MQSPVQVPPQAIFLGLGVLQLQPAMVHVYGKTNFLLVCSFVPLKSTRKTKEVSESLEHCQISVGTKHPKKNCDIAMSVCNISKEGTSKKPTEKPTELRNTYRTIHDSFYPIF